jgi:hypothetical protein
MKWLRPIADRPDYEIPGLPYSLRQGQRYGFVDREWHCGIWKVFPVRSLMNNHGHPAYRRGRWAHPSCSLRLRCLQSSPWQRSRWMRTFLEKDLTRFTALQRYSDPDAHCRNGSRIYAAPFTEAEY